ncbi:MAG: ATP synthase subunit I [Desulfotomaculaceae bacterium]
MRELDVPLTKTLRIAGFLLIMFLVLYVFGYRSGLSLGAAVGTAVSIWSGYFLGARMKRVSEVPASQAFAFMLAGFFLRFGLVVLALYMAFRLPWLDLPGVALGIFTVPVIFISQVVKMNRKG